MLSRHRARWAVLLACAAFVTVAAPASAQTQRATDAVLLASTLADGFTAIDARHREVRTAVGAWYAEQGRCAEPPRIRARFRRSWFTGVRQVALHGVALRALAPELAQLTERLRALPVTDPAIRGGIREVLLDYRNARELMRHAPLDLCEVLRVAEREPIVTGLGGIEDVRGTIRAVKRRETRLRAAQRALLAIEVDPRLARSLDTVFEHATAGLYRSRLNTRERLAPPFAIVTDGDELARVRAEAASVAAATDTLFAAQGRVARRLREALRRGSRCDRALDEGIDRRPVRVLGLFASWLIGELSAAAEKPLEQYFADVAAVGVADPALLDLLRRASEAAAWVRDVPRTNLCHRLRAWRRAGWPRGAGTDPFFGDFGGSAGSGIRLEDATIDRALLRRRGVAREDAAAIIDPVSVLVESLDVDDQSSSTQAVASSVRAASAAVTSRGALRQLQATSAEATGSAGAR
jgi:hypothetical protein